MFIDRDRVVFPGVRIHASSGVDQRHNGKPAIGRDDSSGCLAMLAAIRRASSCVSTRLRRNIHRFMLGRDRRVGDLAIQRVPALCQFRRAEAESLDSLRIGR